MRVLVTGGTGLVGGRLVRRLTAEGHAVTVVSREPGRVPFRSVGWDGIDDVIGETDAVVNLAGEPIAAGRWTEARKREIRESRIDGTRVVVRAMREREPRPKVLVNASATGYYGDRGDEELDESAPAGHDRFTATLCKAWEAEALAAEPLGVRVVRLRIGVVLAPDGGAMAKLLIPFRACLGGPIAGGRQWMPWVHVDDVVGIVTAALASEEWAGPVNATAPNPVRNADFTRILGRVIQRPAVLPLPAFALRLALGEMATILLDSQRAVPAAALARGYEFRYPQLAPALETCAWPPR
jgi:uncharacterized protein (TIGR01777 family)